MRSGDRMFCRFAVVLIGLTGMILVFALSAGAQARGSAAKKTAAPAGWQEKWMGMYAGQDQAGQVAPPGFKVQYAPEPDTIDLVDSLLQPWARVRREATKGLPQNNIYVVAACLLGDMV